MSTQIQGSLSYLGVRAPKPPNFFKYDRAPTTKDYKKFTIGEIWLEENTENIWMLTDKKANVATWTQFDGGGVGTAKTFTTDDANVVIPDALGNVDVLGGTNIGTTGAIANTITINLDDSIHLTGDLDVDGTTTTYDLHVTHNADIDGDLNVDGSVQVDVDLNVDGTTTTYDLHVTHNADIDGDLNVDGSTQIDVDLNVDGDTTINNLDVNGTVDLGLGTGVVLSTADVLSASAGTTDYVLTSNGAGVVPSWKTSSAPLEADIDDFRPAGNLGSVGDNLKLVGIIYTGSYYIANRGGLIYYTDDLEKGWLRNYSLSGIANIACGNGVIVATKHFSPTPYQTYIYAAANPYDIFDILEVRGGNIDVYFANGYFVTSGRSSAGASYTGVFLYSTDPRTVSWTAATYTFPVNSITYYTTYANGYFISLGVDVSASTTILIYSTTITGTFTRNSGANSAQRYYIGWDGTYFGTTSRTNLNVIDYSATINGAFSANTLPSYYTSMIYSDTHWTYGKPGTSTLMRYDTLANGSFASFCHAGTTDMKPLVGVNNKSIAVGDATSFPATVYTDDPTGVWTGVFSGYYDYTINDICFDGTNYIFVGLDSSGNAGLFYSSDIDGRFIKSTTFPTTHGNDITYHNGYYVASGSTSTTTVLYSTSINGAWTVKSVSLTGTSQGIAFIESGNGYFVVVSYATGGIAAAPEVSVATDPSGTWTLSNHGLPSGAMGFEYFSEKEAFVISVYGGTRYDVYTVSNPNYRWSDSGMDVTTPALGAKGFTYGGDFDVTLSSAGQIYYKKKNDTMVGGSSYSSSGAIDYKFDLTPYDITYSDGIFVMIGTGSAVTGTRYGYCSNIASKPNFASTAGTLPTSHLKTLNNKMIAFGAKGSVEYTKVSST